MRKLEESDINKIKLIYGSDRVMRLRGNKYFVGIRVSNMDRQVVNSDGIVFNTIYKTLYLFNDIIIAVTFGDIIHVMCENYIINTELKYYYGCYVANDVLILSTSDNQHLITKQKIVKVSDDKSKYQKIESIGNDKYKLTKEKYNDNRIYADIFNYDLEMIEADKVFGRKTNKLFYVWG